LLKTVLILVALAVPAFLHASTLSGTIKDPSGAVIPGVASRSPAAPKKVALNQYKEILER